MSSSDPLIRAFHAIKAAERERDNLNSSAEQLRLENHQLRRRLGVAEEQNQALQTRVAEMVDQVEAANERAEAHQRAMSNHAGRT